MKTRIFDCDQCGAPVRVPNAIKPEVNVTCRECGRRHTADWWRLHAYEDKHFRAHQDLRNAEEWMNQ